MDFEVAIDQFDAQQQKKDQDKYGYPKYPLCADIESLLAGIFNNIIPQKDIQNQ